MKKGRKTRKGRPLKGSVKRVRTSFTLTPGQVSWLKDQARASGRSKSEVLSAVIDEAHLVRSDSSSTLQLRFHISKIALELICRRYHIKKLMAFGSILRPDFSPESDIDLLVVFKRGHAPGFFTISRIEKELSKLLDGRKVDIRTKSELSPYFRSEVIDEAEVLYAA